MKAWIMERREMMQVVGGIHGFLSLELTMASRRKVTEERMERRKVRMAMERSLRRKKRRLQWRLRVSP